MSCSVAQSLDVLGDRWTLLVVREAFLGTRRFGEFEEALGISKNVLTQRLGHLVERGVVERVDVGQHGTHYEYVLTAMGRDLVVVMTALREWGDRWLFGPGKEPLVVHDRRTGQRIPRLRIRGQDGETLRGSDMEVRPGPGIGNEAPARDRSRARS